MSSYEYERVTTERIRVTGSLPSGPTRQELSDQREAQRQSDILLTQAEYDATLTPEDKARIANTLAEEWGKKQYG